MRESGRADCARAYSQRLFQLPAGPHYTTRGQFQKAIFLSAGLQPG